MAPEANGFDVLVIGSEASGLAAAVSAEAAGARVALATKGALQSCIEWCVLGRQAGPDATERAAA